MRSSFFVDRLMNGCHTAVKQEFQVNFLNLGISHLLLGVHLRKFRNADPNFPRFKVSDTKMEPNLQD